MSRQDHRFEAEAFPRLVTARDGAALVLRHVEAADAPHVRAAYDEWTEEEKRNRCLFQLPHLSEAQAAELAAIADPERHFCLVLTPPEEPRRLLAGARLIADRDGRAAEFAVSVRHAMHHRGLGELVLAAALEEGRRRGVREVWGLIGIGNAPMRNVAGRLGFAFSRNEDDVATVVARRVL